MAGVLLAHHPDALARLRATLDPTYRPPADRVDHHQHPWVIAHLPAPHPCR